MLLQLIFTFLKIGLFTFGGGYAMISLIQSEVVVTHGWITAQEFTDILAVSQMTPGPVGINVATYTGYTALLHAGYSPLLAIVGSLCTSAAVLLLPILLMLAVSRWLLRHSDNVVVKSVMMMLRLTVIGVIASAAVVLLNVDSFGRVGWNRQFVVSVLLFFVVFSCSLLPRERQIQLGGRSIVLRRPSPIWLLIISGAIGAIVYAL